MTRRILLNFFLAALVAFSLLSTLVHAAPPQRLEFPSSSTYGGKKVTLHGEFHPVDEAANRKPPVVILMHGCGGLSGPASRAMRLHANSLADAGFASLVLDSFTARGVAGGWVCEKVSRMASAWGYRKRDIIDAVKYLTVSGLIDPENLFLMGQSNGGSVASIAASKNRIPGLRGSVSYYPWCGAVPLKPKRPLLLFVGMLDRWTPPEECFKRKQSGGSFEIKSYRNAHHSFDLPISLTRYQGRMVGGNPTAADDSPKAHDFIFQETPQKVICHSALCYLAVDRFNFFCCI